MITCVLDFQRGGWLILLNEFCCYSEEDEDVMGKEKVKLGGEKKGTRAYRGRP